jgi:hypothetical protein
MSNIKLETLSKRTVLSILWIFLMLNFIYCDVLAMHDASYLKDLLAGEAGGIEFTPGFLLGASVLMEIPIAMVLLSRVLPYRANRYANMFAGMFMAVVQFSSLFLGSSPSPSYIFFSVIEIATLLFIVQYAWKWTIQEK